MAFHQFCKVPNCSGLTHGHLCPAHFNRLPGKHKKALRYHEAGAVDSALVWLHKNTPVKMKPKDGMTSDARPKDGPGGSNQGRAA